MILFMILVHLSKTIYIYICIQILRSDASYECINWCFLTVGTGIAAAFSKAANCLGCCNKMWKVNTHIHYDHIMGNYGFSVAPGRGRCRGICQGSKCRTFSENWKVGWSHRPLCPAYNVDVLVLISCVCCSAAGQLVTRYGWCIYFGLWSDRCLPANWTVAAGRRSVVPAEHERRQICQAHSRISMNFRLFEFEGALGSASQTPLNSGALLKIWHNNLPALRIGLMKAAEFIWMKTIQLKKNHWRFCTLRGTLLILSPCDLAAHQKHRASKCSERHIISIIDGFQQQRRQFCEFL